MRDYAAAPLLAAHVLLKRLRHQIQELVVGLELVPGPHRSLSAGAVRICFPEFIKAFGFPCGC